MSKKPSKQASDVNGIEKTDLKDRIKNMQDCITDASNKAIQTIAEGQRDGIFYILIIGQSPDGFVMTNNYYGVKNHTVEKIEFSCKNKQTPLKELTPEQQSDLFAVLEERFNKNHKEYLLKKTIKTWSDIKEAFEANKQALWSVYQMEQAGHEPDVYYCDDDGFDVGTCSLNAPEPDSSFADATRRADEIRTNIMTTEEYRNKLLKFRNDCDKKTNCWLVYKTSSRFSPKTGGRFGFGVRIGDVDSNSKLGWRGTVRVPWKKTI
ncbi:DUF4256 domain-containing protein [Candidatus Peregrinibacteria bacterium]|nr:DUF4256 domain-containing protein [Candidatus Peregrinibacteria bacterium]